MKGIYPNNQYSLGWWNVAMENPPKTDRQVDEHSSTFTMAFMILIGVYKPLLHHRGKFQKKKYIYIYLFLNL